MRLALLLAILGAFIAPPVNHALAQTAPRFHNSSGASGDYAPRYSGGDYAPRPSPPVADEYSADYPRPMWTFYEYPRGIPQNLYDPKTPGYRYYPYSTYRSYYPRDQYNRNKVQRYPVR